MYRITIEQVETKQKKKREWERIADSGNPKDDGAIYGYVDNIIDEEETTTLLKQNLETLDITKVIKAINNI